jgi:hypothetical protein
MDKNFWFYVILGVLFIVTNIIVLVRNRAAAGEAIDLPSLVEAAVYAAEQIIPGETGAQKYAFVLAQLQTITKIDDTQLDFVKILIEGAVKKLHLAQAAAQPVTVGVTAEGQRIADAKAAKALGF